MVIRAPEVSDPSGKRPYPWQHLSSIVYVCRKKPVCIIYLRHCSAAFFTPESLHDKLFILSRIYGHFYMVQHRSIIDVDTPYMRAELPHFLIHPFRTVDSVSHLDRIYKIGSAERKLLISGIA